MDVEEDQALSSSADDLTLFQEIEAAHGGDRALLGDLLELFRDDLRLLAARGLGRDLSAKGDASDIVQETLLGAYRDFAKFHGRTREELLAWLQKILSNNLAGFRRRYRDTEKRTVAREVPLGRSSAPALYADLADGRATPATVAQRREQMESVLAGLGRLSAEHRRVIVWRQYDQLSFDEIGQRLGRSAEAARKFWSRALVALTDQLKDTHDVRR
jgi:RNA polymerase sigma-70 factor (ECF subfamily)